MIATINAAKETLSKINALTNRYTKVIEQREEAHKEDMRSRQLLTDPSLPSDRFTAIANQARAAQRRRANLHDKAIEIEEAVRELGMTLQTHAISIISEPMPVNLPVDAAAVADTQFLQEPATDDVVAEEGFVELEEPAEVAA